MPDFEDHPAHDGGLTVDIPHLVDRRRALRLIGGLGLFTLAACSGRNQEALGTDTPASATPAGSTGTADGDCAEIPEETAGPYPADGSQGSNAPNVLSESGVVRSDITKSFGDASGVAGGVPLTVRLNVLSLADGCKPLEGAAVYAWHCDREGRYSLYSQGAENENYCRGVQAADADGTLTFETIFPAAYQGRWPHIHFEVYPDLDSAATASGKLATSQLALPEDTCDEVYTSDGYEQSASNMHQTPLERDMVFADGYSAQMAKVTGDLTSGLVAELTIPV